MIKKILMFVAVLSLAVCAATAQADLLDDGSFDLATHESQTSNSAWVLTVNFPDTIEGAAQFQDAPWASNDAGPPEVGVWFRGFEGQQVPGVDPPAVADLVQSVVVNAGDFSLSFDAKRETFFTAAGWSVSLSSDGTGGSDSIDLLAAVPNDGSWNNYSLSLSGVSAGDTLTVAASMLDGVDALANPQSAFVDNFVLVPEPTSLGLVALSLMGMFVLRRKR